MKTLDNYIHLCKVYVNDPISIYFQVSEFKCSPKYTYSTGRFTGGDMQFKIHCTKYALNWLRIQFGYLPEKKHVNTSNDCNIQLQYTVDLTEKNIAILEQLNKLARHNWLQLISLGSLSSDYASFMPESKKKRDAIKQQIASDSINSDYSKRLAEIDKMYRKLQNDKRWPHAKYRRILRAHK